jgi:hypothetical protein
MKIAELGCLLLFLLAFMSHPPISFDGFGINPGRFELSRKRTLRHHVDSIRSRIHSSAPEALAPSPSRRSSHDVQEKSPWIEFYSAHVAQDSVIDKSFGWSLWLYVVQIQTTTPNKDHLRPHYKYGQNFRTLISGGRHPTSRALASYLKSDSSGPHNTGGHYHHGLDSLLVPLHSGAVVALQYWFSLSLFVFDALSLFDIQFWCWFQNFKKWHDATVRTCSLWVNIMVEKIKSMSFSTNRTMEFGLSD